MDTIEFIAWLVAMPIAYVGLICVIDRLFNRVNDRLGDF